MYPNFQYLMEAITGREMPHWLSLLKTFGFVVGISFVFAAWATALELKRKAKQGLFVPQTATVTVYKPISLTEILINALVGFLIGYKIGGLFTMFDQVSGNPMSYLFSLGGYVPVGLAGAAFAGGLKLYDKWKIRGKQPYEKTVQIYPHNRIMEIVVVAAVGGIVGAKVFNALETWDDFVKNPIENLVASNGLTFLGGLIVATAAFYYYTRKHKIPFRHMCDAAAPGIMLAYGIGRLGCQLSGDGDWGIYNTAYVSEIDGTLRAATPADAGRITQMISGTPGAYFPAPSWLPRWLFGMNYPHNVANEGMHMHGCTGEYCGVLPVSVFPTPVYEAITCILLFFVLWALRKRFKRTLQMFGTYLIFVGVERFFVELIRVNYKYNLGFVQATQAELLSVALVLLGAGLLLFYKDKPPAAPPPAET